MNKELIRLIAEQMTEEIMESEVEYPCCSCKWLLLEPSDNKDINPCKGGVYASRQRCLDFEERYGVEK